MSRKGNTETKRLLFVFTTLALCVTLSGGVFAYFDDTEISADNSLHVGTWAVEVNGQGNTAVFIFKDVYPGNSGSRTWVVTNTGSLSAYVDLNAVVTAAGPGALQDFLDVHVYILDGPDIYGAAGAFAPVRGASANYDLNLPLASGESRFVVLDWAVGDAYVHDPDDEITLAVTFSIKLEP